MHRPLLIPRSPICTPCPSPPVACPSQESAPTTRKSSSSHKTTSTRKSSSTIKTSTRKTSTTKAATTNKASVNKTSTSSKKTSSTKTSSSTLKPVTIKAASTTKASTKKASTTHKSSATARPTNKACGSGKKYDSLLEVCVDVSVPGVASVGAEVEVGKGGANVGVTVDIPGLANIGGGVKLGHGSSTKPAAGATSSSGCTDHDALLGLCVKVGNLASVDASVAGKDGLVTADANVVGIPVKAAVLSNDALVDAHVGSGLLDATVGGKNTLLNANVGDVVKVTSGGSATTGKVVKCPKGQLLHLGICLDVDVNLLGLKLDTAVIVSTLVSLAVHYLSMLTPSLPPRCSLAARALIGFGFGFAPSSWLYTPFMTNLTNTLSDSFSLVLLSLPSLSTRFVEASPSVSRWKSRHL